MAIIKFYLLESLPERSRNSNVKHYHAKKQPCKFQLARGNRSRVAAFRYSVGVQCMLEFFHHNISAFLAHEASPAPAEGYLVCRLLLEKKKPDRFESCEEVRVLLQ